MPSSPALYVVLVAVANLPVVAQAPVAMSITDPSIEGVGGGGELQGQAQKVSDDGRFVVFRSPGGLLLIPGYVGLGNQIFLYDRVDGSVRLVSGSSGSKIAGGNGESHEPAISADGSSIVFRSSSSDLLPGGSGPQTENIYLWDRATETTSLVSHAASGPETRANDLSDEPAISADGTSVAFRSRSTDLVTGEGGPQGENVYLWERATGLTTLVSHAAEQPSTRGNGASSEPFLSRDGAQVAYVSVATDLVALESLPPEILSNIYHWDRASGATTLVTHTYSNPHLLAESDSYQPVLSADGVWLAFQSWSSDLISGTSGPWRNNIYLRHQPTGTTTLVSHAWARPLMRGNRYSHSPVLSADASAVAYTSYSTDLIPNVDNDGEYPLRGNVYLWDRSADTTALVSHAAAGTLVRGNATSLWAAMSANGSTVAYLSDSTDLLAEGGGGTGMNVYAWDRVTNATMLMSHATSGPWVRGNGDSFRPAISASGAVVAFSSAASDLAFGDHYLTDLFVAEIATSEPELVSERAASTIWEPITGNGDSEASRTRGSAISADGRFAVFVSRATDLIAGGSGGTYGNVYLRDRATSTTTLVSHAASMPLRRGDSSSDLPVISADGAFVAYESYSSDLIPGVGGEPTMSIYMWHRATDTTTLVSHAATSPLVRANGAAYNPVIDATGSTVAYNSHATDLVSGGSGPIFYYNVYLWDRSTNETTLVSHAASDPLMRADKNSYGPVIDAGGLSVAYWSHSTDLIAGVSGETGFNVYHWDRTTNSTTLVSHTASDPLVRGEDSSRQPVITADGSSLTYESWSTDLVPGGSGPEGWNVFFWDRTTNGNRLVSHAASGPGARGNGSSEMATISADGSTVAYRSRSTDLIAGEGGPVDENVYLWDRSTDTTTLVSHATGEPSVRGNGGSGQPAVSATGSSLVYSSSSTDLISGGGLAEFYNVYHWDRSTDSTTLVSQSASGPFAGGDGNSFNSAISADGLLIVFESDATNLVSRDFNLATDAFSSQPFALFLDGFENGDTQSWSATAP